MFFFLESGGFDEDFLEETLRIKQSKGTNESKATLNKVLGKSFLTFKELQTILVYASEDDLDDLLQLLV